MEQVMNYKVEVSVERADAVRTATRTWPLGNFFHCIDCVTDDRHNALRTSTTNLVTLSRPSIQREACTVTVFSQDGNLSHHVVAVVQVVI
ncbi:hypothetical protein D3C79_626850 [compost metagenome]